MTDKELKSLSRAEVLELLIDQIKEVERLEKELQAIKEERDNIRIAIKETGSIAEAALKLNGVFEAAQTASDHYLENIRTMQAERSGTPDDAEAGNRGTQDDERHTENQGAFGAFSAGGGAETGTL